MSETSPAILWLLEQAVPFFLVAARIAGVFMLAPILGAFMIPLRFKALMVTAFTGAVFPALVGEGLKLDYVPQDVIELIPYLLTEAMIGFVIGATASLPLLVLEMSGAIAGQQMGLGISRVYNPEADIETDVLGQLLYTMALGAFVAFNGLEILIGTVIDTFQNVPLGAFNSRALPLELFINTLSSGFELAIRVTTPVSGIILMIVMIMGVIGKTMPQINIMTVGFTIKILIGLGALMLATSAVTVATGEHIRESLEDITVWVQSLDESLLRGHANVNTEEGM